MMVEGQCLCGAVRFRGTPVAHRGIGVCHCGQCRQWGGGGPFMAMRFEGGVELTEDRGLTWFRSSEHGERGFCQICGSSLFWRMAGDATDWATNASTIRGDHGQEIFEHIWVDDQPHWYAFADDRPRRTAADVLGGSS